MENKKPSPTHEEWIELLDTDRWEIADKSNASESPKGTLRNLTKAAHERQQSGQAPGIITHIESAIELDLIQLQKLWEYLGLPT